MLKIIHIRSSGKSGSTLLNIILGNYREIFAGAELFRYSRLWTRAGFMKCASGKLVSESPFWIKVKNAAIGADLQIVEDDIHARHIPPLMGCILQESGAKIVCDTSKSRRYSKVIYDQGEFKPFVIHLVRDGRAVVFSANKPFLQSLKVGMIWCVANLQTKIRYGGKDNYLCVRYEDLVFDTDAVNYRIERHITKFFDLDLTLLPYDRNMNTARHSFAGNRMRDSFDGSITFDSRYLERGVSWWQWSFLTLMMSPALMAFKYPLLRKYCKAAFLGS